MPHLRLTYPLGARCRIGHVQESAIPPCQSPSVPSLPMISTQTHLVLFPPFTATSLLVFRSISFPQVSNSSIYGSLCIICKICLLTFNAIHGHGPEYMSEMLIPRSIHYGLRSQDDLKLDVPRTKRKPLGDLAFKVAAPKLWNSLLKDVRSCNNVSIFKSKLKTHYFRIAYNSLIHFTNLNTFTPVKYVYKICRKFLLKLLILPIL